MTKFTDKLHEAGNGMWQKSMKHPFIKELQSGELPIETFRFYLLQDRYYLNEFSKLHELIATKTANKETSEFLLARAQDLKDVEITVRNHFFEELKITSDEIVATPVAPTAYNYVNHMFMTLNLYGVKPAVAALVPCYWLYQEIGQAMAEKGSPVSYYQEWIDTYDGDWYAVNVEKMLNLTNSLAETATADELSQMTDAFVRSSYYELQFWQMAYTKQKWE